MKIAVYLRNIRPEDEELLSGLLERLAEAGCRVYTASCSADLQPGTDIVMSVGGDGTFLYASALVGRSGIPVLGVNFGRLGFLSENKAGAVADALLKGEYVIEQRSLLRAEFSAPTGCTAVDGWPYALNEVTVHRSGAAMLGVDVSIDGALLPTYWADGLLVATSSGSTAYSLSVGGPIVLPESKVLLISPIAPHNLNVRPLVVPDTSRIRVSVRSRDEKLMLTMDNRNVEIDRNLDIGISMAQFSLNRVRLKSSNFINALTEKLFWGEDIRNSTEQ